MPFFLFGPHPVRRKGSLHATKLEEKNGKGFRGPINVKILQLQKQTENFRLVDSAFKDKKQTFICK